MRNGRRIKPVRLSNNVPGQQVAGFLILSFPGFQTSSAEALNFLRRTAMTLFAIMLCFPALKIKETELLRQSPPSPSLLILGDVVSLYRATSTSTPSASKAEIALSEMPLSVIR